VSVLLEQDLVAASAAEAGHQAFNDEITRVLNELIPTLGVGNSTPSPDDLAALSGQIGDKVRAAIVEEGNLLQDLFAGVDPDDVVGFNVFLFSHRDLLAQPQQTFSASYGDAGRYDVTGTVTAVGV
jgi:fructose-specific component phosphotransferase system IIB-like protein